MAVKLALSWVETENPKTKEERTRLFLSLFPDGELKHLPFSGGIARFDFSGVTFKSCSFNHVRWGNCKFDEDTSFINCSFSGFGSANYCEGLGDAEWIDCITDQEGQAFINSQKIKAGRKAYTREDLKGDIDNLLRKFLVSGGLGFKRVNINNIKSGHFGASRYSDEILKGLSDVIEEIKGPGGAERRYYQVCDKSKEAMHFFAINNVYTGCIRKAYEALANKLCT